MKKIGFIDYFLDEYHANNYPQWIRATKRGYDVAMAWEEVTRKKGKPLRVWCEEHRVEPTDDVEKVVESCDFLVVLAPSNPETHERLAEIPLKSGKPVYIDKPFAPDRGAAERLFDLARKNGTPLMSSSALRFGGELQKAVRESHRDAKASFVNVRGGGTSFWEYSIHLLEMMVMLMGGGAKRVMQCGTGETDHMLVDYEDERRACLTLGSGQPFALSAYYGERPPLIIDKMDGFWTGFVDSLLTFFDTGVPAIPEAETVEIISLVETGVKALDVKDEWIDV